MRRMFVVVVALVLGAAATAYADHRVPTFAPQGPLSTAINAGGEEASWELIDTIATGNPQTDLDFFTRDGDTYLSAGTLANGPNAGGQTIVKLTENGVVEPEYVTGHPSASCLSLATGITGLQHDVEATPKGGQILNAPNAFPDDREAQLLIDTSDAPGRCHDQGVFGAANVPRGGLEIIDVTNPAEPVEIGLTVHTGEAHTVNIDPKRPHIAYVATSDATSRNEQGQRANESSGNAMDGFEVVDLSSCMNVPAPAGQAGKDAKRAACRPEVYRYRWPDATFATSSEYPNSLAGCHETEIYADDKLSCASVQATVLFDLSGAFDDRGTPNDYTDDKPRGTPLPCRVRDSETVLGEFKTGAKVTDCHKTGPLPDDNNTVARWLANGAPSLEGVRRIGTVHHAGFSNQQQQGVDPPYSSKDDVFVSHEAELTGSGRNLLVTDERGGGVIPGGASCSTSPSDIERGNGGIHAYSVGRLRTTQPANAEEAQQAYARTSQGEKAVYRATVRTQPQGAFCTAHVMQQIPGQNRIFMGWYSQGTQVVDYVENRDGTVDFKEAGYFIPENANTWTSAIFKYQCNRDDTVTYWGATGDFTLAGAGRNAIDIYKVTLPAPPMAPRRAGTPQCPTSDVKGVEIGRTAPVCAASSGLEAVNARPRRRGLRFSFSSRGGRPVDVEVLRQSKGRRLGRTKRVKIFRKRGRAFNWNGRARGVRDGYYVARFKTRAPNGRRDTRRVALRRAHGRFRRLGRVERVEPCDLLSSYKLRSSVFNRKKALRATFRLRESSRVTVTVKRHGKRLKRYRGTFAARRTHRIRFNRRKLRLGDYRVTLRANTPGKNTQSTLVARRLR